MAILQVNIPNAILTEFGDAFKWKFGYQPTLENGSPNPQSAIDFVKAQYAKMGKDVLKEYRRYLVNQASIGGDNEVDAININVT